MVYIMSQCDVKIRSPSSEESDSDNETLEFLILVASYDTYLTHVNISIQTSRLERRSS